MISRCFAPLIAGSLFAISPAVAGDVTVLTPSVSYNAGLRDLAAIFTQKTGIRVTIARDPMAKMVDDSEKSVPPADVIMLPEGLMDTLEKDGGIKPDSRILIGRVEVGLAVKAGATHPDISTVPKLIAVLKSARAVMYSNPYHGSLEAEIIDRLLKRPEFHDVHGEIGTQGEGGQSLARGQGDMALQIIDEILPYPEISLVGPLPPELNAHIDMAVAVSARSTNPEDANAFVHFVTSTEAAPIWKAKGLDKLK
jgi:molybdate transport system substrate-binding protein